MSSVVNRIQKLFPGESFDLFEQNGLMERIRVPKNILYLSDRLPKPRYNDSMTEVKKRKTGSFGDCALPALPVKKPRQIAQPYLESILASKQLARQFKVPKKILVSHKPIVPIQEDAVEIAKNESPIIPARIKGMKQPRQIKKQQQRSDIIHEESLISNNKDESLIDNDEYIRQLVSKKNPLVRPAQRIADIYAGGNAQNIIAMQKNKIDRILEMGRRNKIYQRVPRALLKGSYDVSPYLEPPLKGIRPRLMPYSLGGLQIRGKLNIPSPLKAIKRDKKMMQEEKVAMN